MPMGQTSEEHHLEKSKSSRTTRSYQVAMQFVCGITVVI